jgi:hypothetical protein
MSCAAYEASQLRNPDGPKAGFWTEAGCTGDLLELNAGDYPNLSYFKIAGKPMVNRIKSAWIPPTMKATVFADTGCKSGPCSGPAMWNYGLGYADMGPGQHPTISNAVGNSNIDAIKLTTARTWDEFLDACCRGIPGDGVSQETCGAFWRPKSEQGTGACDFRVQEYCRVNPADPFCACYGSDLTTISSVPGECKQVAPKCYSSACTSGNAYRPSSQLKDVCIPCKVCKQNVSITGNSNMFNDNVILMDCSGGNAAVPSGAQPAPTNMQSGNTIGSGTADQAAKIRAAKEAADAANSTRQMQIILVVIAVVIFAVWFGWGQGESTQSYPQYPQAQYSVQPSQYSVPPSQYPAQPSQYP